MSWNYRLAKSKYKDEDFLEIIEVYYDDNNKIIGYGNDLYIPTGSTKEEIKHILNDMLKALNEPVLNMDDVIKDIETNKKNNTVKLTGKITSIKRMDEKLI